MDISNFNEYEKHIENLFDTLTDEEKLFNAMNEIQYPNQSVNAKISKVNDFRLKSISEYNNYALGNIENLISLYTYIEELLIYGCGKSYSDSNWIKDNRIKNVKNYIRLLLAHDMTLDLMSKMILKVANETKEVECDRNKNDKINQSQIDYLSDKLSKVDEILTELNNLVNISKNYSPTEKKAINYVDSDDVSNLVSYTVTQMAKKASLINKKN